MCERTQSETCGCSSATAQQCQPPSWQQAQMLDVFTLFLIYVNRLPCAAARSLQAAAAAAAAATCTRWHTNAIERNCHVIGHVTDHVTGRALQRARAQQPAPGP